MPSRRVVSLICCISLVVIGGVRKPSVECGDSQNPGMAYSDTPPLATSWTYRLPSTGADFFRDLGGADLFFCGHALRKDFFSLVSDRDLESPSRPRTLQAQHVCLQI